MSYHCRVRIFDGSTMSSVTTYYVKAPDIREAAAEVRDRNGLREKHPHRGFVIREAL